MSDFLTGENLKIELSNPLLGQDAIVEGLIFKDTVNIFYSDPGVGKSVFAVNMMASMSGGWPVFGMFPMKRYARCSYLQLEGSKDEQLGRLKDISNIIPIDYEHIAWHTNPLFVENQYSVQQIIKELDQFKPEVVFVDSFYCLTNKGLSKEEGFLPVRQLIKQLRSHTNAAFIILHHAQKPQYEKGKKVEKDDPFLGSQYMKAFADMMIYCKRDSKTKTILEVTKPHRNNEGITKITLSFDKMTWTVKAIPEETSKSSTAVIADFLRSEFSKGKDVKVEDIVKATGFTMRHIRRLKNDAHFNHLCDFHEIEGKATVWKKLEVT